MSQCTIVVNILLFLCVCCIFSNSKFLIIYTGIACRSKVVNLENNLSPKVAEQFFDHSDDKIEDESVHTPTFEPKYRQQFIEIITFFVNYPQMSNFKL